MSLYDADGKIRTTVVDGLSYTGLHAADGSINIVEDDANHFGVYHPCGALRVNTGTAEVVHDGTGAFYSNRIMGHQG